MQRSELINYLNNYLEVDKIPDISLNGLQVEGKAEIKSIGVAVDACLDSIMTAVKAKTDFLIVHHGLFWDKPESLVGNNFRRIKELIDGKLNLYCSHLPLDWHPQVGNNSVLARRLGFEPISGFGQCGAADGRSIGCIAIAGDGVEQAEFIRKA